MFGDCLEDGWSGGGQSQAPVRDLTRLDIEAGGGVRIAARLMRSLVTYGQVSAVVQSEQATFFQSPPPTPLVPPRFESIEASQLL